LQFVSNNIVKNTYRSQIRSQLPMKMRSQLRKETRSQLPREVMSPLYNKTAYEVMATNKNGVTT